MHTDALRINTCSRILAASILVSSVFLLPGCGSDGTTTATATGGGGTGGNARIIGFHHGRLVDVYGLRTIGSERFVDLAQADVVIGPDIEDQRVAGSRLSDADVDYDFINPNPDTLQPRLLIPREIGSPEFEALLGAVDDKLRSIDSAAFSRDSSATFSTVPRNAGIQITFSEDLGIDDSFFVQQDVQGRITGIKNTEAVQLLRIVGDPTDGNPRGDFQAIPARIIPRGNLLIIDPVLLGSEGARFKARNNATGLPESPNQVGANIRIAIALEGPLAIPGVVEKKGSNLISTNNGNARSVVRDFRSGNREDDNAEIASGFVRDPEPPRIVGELLTFLERVDRAGDATTVVTVFKNDRNHEIDRGDVLRIVDPDPGLDGDSSFAIAEIVAEPEDDFGLPEVQHVRVVVRNVEKFDTIAVNGEIVQRRRTLEDIDPSNDPNFPTTIDETEEWLRRNAPRAVLVSEFTASRRRPDGAIYGDDPANFLTFSPAPLPDLNGDIGLGTLNVSPFAGAILRFSKPVNLATVRTLDTFFFATRPLLDKEKIIKEFVEPNLLDRASFNFEKFKTPHLVVSRLFDEDGSQTSLRLQPVMGFFLNDEMRPSDANSNGGLPFKPFPYYLHLLGGKDGIQDLSGNPIDFQSQVRVQESLTIPFTLDTRPQVDGKPVFADNLVVSIPRRFASEDEDEQPSLYLDDETQKSGRATNALAFELRDVFGAVVYLNDGKLLARPTSRVTQIVDDVNQAPPPAQGSDLQTCPVSIAGDPQVASASAGVRFGSPLQNPLNPFGARLQTVWREIDMGLSRVDPFDFNLDVEQMLWAPFTLGEISYDEFDRVSLFLSHSEHRPETCVGLFAALPSMPGSGLVASGFQQNIARNLEPNTARIVETDAQVPAFVDERLRVDPAQAVRDPTETYRYLPLPKFQKPYFVWRDETSEVQGANSGIGIDVWRARPSAIVPPYILSPYLAGEGRFVTQGSNGLQFNRGKWLNFTHQNLSQTAIRDRFTDGQVGSIALPLLADFWVYPDDPALPEGAGFRATGFNGWQIAIAAQSSPQPNFRAYSGGFAGFRNQPPVVVDPSAQAWTNPSGGYTPRGALTGNPADNSVFWIMADFLKRQTVVTSGFVELTNPHRMPQRSRGEGDPRLGPYYITDNRAGQRPQDIVPRFDWVMEPSQELLPPGTAVIPEFRAAGRVDPLPWRSTAIGIYLTGEDPSPVNFPLDPLKAGDAHIKKYDDRRGANGLARNHWTGFYNHHVSGYTQSINQITDPDFLTQFSGEADPFQEELVRYFNWRFIMRNNVDVNPSTSPTLESFAVVYRFEKK